MYLLQLLSFINENCEVYFSNVFTSETRLSKSPVLVIIYFFLLSYALTLTWPKSLSRGLPLYALRNQLDGNTESPMSFTWIQRG